MPEDLDAVARFISAVGFPAFVAVIMLLIFVRMHLMNVRVLMDLNETIQELRDLVLALVTRRGNDDD